MKPELPKDVRELIYQAINHPGKRSDAIRAVEAHIDYLYSQGRFADCEDYITDERQQLLREVAAISSEKKRASFSFVVKTLGPLLIAGIVQLATHFPNA
ncbi:hypothetical protein [Rhizobium brockwellii]|uniref:hypothetical protein n=1 Tax=Rhizobium brockwellii TaxID=3019932 RepID=UPI00293DFCE1|nr:hypothetical protein [Rhizobium brockwellii]MDV4155251.1 hypothetical protein [Rhizobium brockwellii]